jgi:phage N-6-adenine-methyltransferase
LKIIEEIQKHLIPLKHDEYCQLEENIISDGCRDYLVIWNDILIDGHNRYEICTKHSLPFKTINKDFADLDEAIEWVENNQLGRRNLTPDQFKLYLGRKYNRQKSQGIRNDLTSRQFGEKLTTAEKIAAQHRVSARTVERAGAIAKDIDNAAPEIVKLVETGEVSVSAAAMAAALPEEDQQDIVAEINAGVKPVESIKNHVLVTKNTGDEEWYTPREFIESARKVMGEITVDPASNEWAQGNVKADTYFTIDDDGLTKDWFGKVWMNPPYTSRVINKFIEKLIGHYQSGDVSEAIVLTNNSTDTSWFHQGAKTASAICFTSGRINFLKSDGKRSSPTNGQSFFYFGCNVEAFKNAFSVHGLIMVKA